MHTQVVHYQSMSWLDAFPEHCYRDRHLAEGMAVKGSVCLGNDVQFKKILWRRNNIIILSFTLETQEKGNYSSEMWSIVQQVVVLNLTQVIGNKSFAN